jgi:hypothetical protein
VELDEETKQLVRRVLSVIDQVDSEDYDSQIAKLDIHEWAIYDRIWKEVLEELMVEGRGVVVAYAVSEQVRKLVRQTRFERDPVI